MIRMDARQSFKHGFISRCIEAGMTDVGQIRDFVKSAMEKEAFLGEAFNMAKDIGGRALTLGGGLAIVAPPILGGIAGTLAAKSTDVDDFDVDEAKHREVIDEYRRQASRLQRLGLLRRHEATAQRSGRAFM